MEEVWGDIQQITWTPVLLGCSRDAQCGVEHLIVASVPVKYRQFEEETCTFSGFASALHYCSGIMKMGDKQLVSQLSSGAPSSYAKGRNAPAQLDLLSKKVKGNSTYFRKSELRAQQSRVEEWDILNRRLPGPPCWL